MYLDEKPSLQALPAESYRVSVHTQAKLSRDCHLVFDGSFYSSPHTLRGRELDVWASTQTVEIFSEGTRVAFHARSKARRSFVTDNNHYPPAHLAFLEEDVQKVISRAVEVGPQTEKLIRDLLEGQPLKHFRRSQGIVARSWKYGALHLENAALEANRFGNQNVQYLERVIKAQKGVPLKTENEIKQRSYNPFLRGLTHIH